MRISDWSSDVCSSDLRDPDAVEATARYTAALERAVHPKEGKGRKRPKQERENHAETQHLDAPISCCACSFMDWASHGPDACPPGRVGTRPYRRHHRHGAETIGTSAGCEIGRAHV